MFVQKHLLSLKHQLQLTLGLKVKKIILEKEIDQFEAQRNDESAEEAPRPTKEISCVQLYDVEDSGDRHVYLIAGKKDIMNSQKILIQ